MNLPTMGEVRGLCPNRMPQPGQGPGNFSATLRGFRGEQRQGPGPVPPQAAGHGAAWRAGPGGARALQVQPQRPGPGGGRGLPAHLAGHQGPAAGLDHARPGPGHPHKLLPRPHVLPMAEPRGLHHPPRPPRHFHPVAGHGQGQGTADRADSIKTPTDPLQRGT